MVHIKMLIATFVLTSAVAGASSAGESVDTLLPPPRWTFNHADALKIDPQVRKDMEKLYREAEPGYHEAVGKVQARTKSLHETLVRDELDQETILKRMKKLLEAETEVKLYQVKVRMSLLSKLSSEQRAKARQLARREPEVQKALEAKVRKVQELAERIKQSGQSVDEIRDRMEDIGKVIRVGRHDEGSKMLDQLLKQLESALHDKGSDKKSKEDGNPNADRAKAEN